MTTTKFLTATFKGKDEEQRTIWAKASAPILDRDKEIIRADAWQLENFKKHPVLLVSHDYQKLWVGAVEDINAKADGLYFAAKFAKTAEANEVWGLIKDTGIASFSVGFLPIASENVPVRKLGPVEQKAALAVGMTLDSVVKVFTKVELLEISIVSVPSNTAARLQAWKGKLKSPALRVALAAKSKGDGLDELLNIEEDIFDGDPEELARVIKEIVRDALEVGIAKLRGRVI